MTTFFANFEVEVEVELKIYLHVDCRWHVILSPAARDRLIRGSRIV